MIITLEKDLSQLAARPGDLCVTADTGNIHMFDGESWIYVGGAETTYATINSKPREYMVRVTQCPRCGAPVKLHKDYCPWCDSPYPKEAI